MALGPVAATDRRHRRRQETIEEILDIAVQIMAEHGVAGLSIGEIARRMGIRPPSVYVYFPSKHALYDALFARGARLLLAAMQEVLAAMQEVTAALPARPATLEEILLPGAQAFVRWSVEHAAYSQLLFWRPVPGFTPSPQAYQAAIELVELGRDQLKALQDAGLLRADAPIEQIERDWTILLSGVVSQQLSNAPQQAFDEGHFTAAIPGLLAMFVGHYSPPALAQETSRQGRH
jgi:AcrR family transcriptional regulator